MNNARVESDEWVPQPTDFLGDRWLVLRRGKRHIAGVQRVTAPTRGMTPVTRGNGLLTWRFDSLLALP